MDSECDQNDFRIAFYKLLLMTERNQLERFASKPRIAIEVGLDSQFWFYHRIAEGRRGRSHRRRRGSGPMTSPMPFSVTFAGQFGYR